MTDKRVKLGNHVRWRVGEPIPPRDLVLKHIRQLPVENGEHWVLNERKGVRWHHAGTYQAQLKWRGGTFNVARVLIAYARFEGRQPPHHVNTCKVTECVNPAHWVAPLLRNAPLEYVLEQRPVGFVITRGGKWPTKDVLVRAGKHGTDVVHLLRVLVDDHMQTLRVLCGAALDDHYLVTTRDANCTTCIA